ncbi:hypothetical protein ABZV14_20010 [Streptosporangium canum]|uniref:hypothetical protein n=1 Tax=Streptosporangium canum TaxID=324952 RepID=UPI0033A6FF8D
MGRVLDRPDWTATVHEVARALYAHADVDGDTAWWPTLRGDPGTVRPRRPYWCSGSSGIGSFLVRYWHATGDRRCQVRTPGFSHGGRSGAGRRSSAWACLDRNGLRRRTPRWYGQSRSNA